MHSPPLGRQQATPGPSRATERYPVIARSAPEHNPLSNVTRFSSSHSLASLHHSTSQFDSLHNQTTPFPSISQDNIIQHYHDRIPSSHPSHNLHLLSQRSRDDPDRINPTPLPVYQPPPSPIVAPAHTPPHVHTPAPDPAFPQHAPVTPVQLLPPVALLPPAPVAVAVPPQPPQPPALPAHPQQQPMAPVVHHPFPIVQQPAAPPPPPPLYPPPYAYHLPYGQFPAPPMIGYPPFPYPYMPFPPSTISASSRSLPTTSHIPILNGQTDFAAWHDGVKALIRNLGGFGHIASLTDPVPQDRPDMAPSFPPTLTATSSPNERMAGARWWDIDNTIEHVLLAHLGSSARMVLPEDGSDRTARLVYETLRAHFGLNRRSEGTNIFLALLAVRCHPHRIQDYVTTWQNAVNKM